MSGILGWLGIVKNPGAHVPHRKNTSACATVDMPVPKEVSIPMSMHIGAPCQALVKVGDQVCVGQKIGDNDKGMCAPIHSSVSGKVKKIESLLMSNGSKSQTVIIETDGLQTVDPSIAPPVINDDADFIKAVKESGLVGLGGAGFPAHVKLNVKPEVKEKIDTLLINGAECEPYITSDIREIMESPQDILDGIAAVAKHLDVKTVYIGIENNKPEGIALLNEMIPKDPAVKDIAKVKVLPATYPQGAEKVLIKQCTGREVPPGKLPSDVGCVVMNVGSIAFLARYLKTGMPLVSKRLTVDGSAVTNPQNVRVAIGTRIKDLIEFCGGYKEEAKKILYGGPMMGTAVSSDELPIMKQNNAILAFNAKDAKLWEPTECIRCGRCVDACPMGLMPVMLENYTELKNTDELKKFNIMNCMECGCCSFVCPAGRKLVQSIRVGKALVRNS